MDKSQYRTVIAERRERDKVSPLIFHFLFCSSFRATEQGGRIEIEGDKAATVTRKSTTEGGPV